MNNTLASPTINSVAEAEIYVEHILGEIKSMRNEMKMADLQIARLREETMALKVSFGHGATEGEIRIRELNALLNRLFPSSTI